VIKNKTPFMVYVEWNYEDSKCIVSHAYEEPYEDFDIIGKGGNEGMSIAFYDTLEEAIINSGYNPKAIIWGDNLTKKEMQLKDKIVDKYVWSYLEGYKLKGEK